MPSKKPASASSTSPAPARNLSGIPKGRNRVRIIGGAFRSRVIEFPDALGLRPTADRVRETLFNWLGQTMTDLDCLDLFAGSGALGFEAASRGAASVVLTESNRGAVGALKRNITLLKAAQCEVIATDALQFIDATDKKFDVIFIDPPFGSDYLPKLLPKLARCLKPEGCVYAEWHEPLAEVISASQVLDANTNWRILREGRAGKAFFALLSAEVIHPQVKP